MSANWPLQTVWKKIASYQLPERAKKVVTAPVVVDKPTEEVKAEILGERADAIFGELHEDYTIWTISAHELSRIANIGLAGGASEGNILWLHYCDYDAKYCETSYKKNIIDDYTQAYPNELSYILKPFPPTNKEKDVLAHRAALCVANTSDQQTYMSFYAGLYSMRAASRKDPTKLAGLWEDLGVRNMRDCRENNSYELAIYQEKQLAKNLFKVRTLPANVFINQTTGEWILVPGYYKTDEVLPAIEYVM